MATNMQVKFKDIPTPQAVNMTPSRASKLLEAHAAREAFVGRPLNRNTNRNRSVRYARDMTRDNWIFNGDMIMISEHGRIVDGKTRLTGCVESKEPFPTFLVTGIKEAPADIIFKSKDSGAPKLTSVFIHTDSEFKIPVKHANAVTAAAKHCIVYENDGEGNRYSLSRTDIIRYIKDEGLINETAGFLNRGQSVSNSKVIAWGHLMGRIDINEARKFCDDVQSGAMLQVGDPVLALANRLRTNSQSCAKLSTNDIFAMGIVAWNARRAGKMLKTINPPRERCLPRLV